MGGGTRAGDAATKQSASRGDGMDGYAGAAARQQSEQGDTSTSWGHGGRGGGAISE